MQTYAHTYSVKQASDFAQQHLLTDVMMQPLRCSLLCMRHSRSTYRSLLLASLQVDAEPGTCCPLSVWVEVVQGER